MREDLFFINIKSDTKEDAIKYMTDKLIKSDVINQEIAEAIIAREQIAPTEINELVAIPHCISKTGTKSVLAIGILDKPILWDKTFVQLVFLGSLDPSIKSNRGVFTMLYKLTKNIEKVKELVKEKTLREFKGKLFIK